MAHANDPARRGTMADCHAVDPKLPRDWLCPNADDVCISLHTSKSAYCCPHDTDCNRIPTMPFAYNNTPTSGVLAPDTRFFILNTNQITQRCDSLTVNGCPYGYHCLYPDINHVPFQCRVYGRMAITPNKDSISEASSVVTLPTPLPTGTISLIPGPTDRPAPSTSPAANDTAAQDTGSGRTDTSVIVGATLGAAVGIIAIVLAAMVYLRYIRKSSSQDSDKNEKGGDGQKDTEYWSYDGRKDANGQSMSRWSTSTLNGTPRVSPSQETQTA